jgi:uncharacterized protein (DUF1697 family)
LNRRGRDDDYGGAYGVSSRTTDLPRRASADRCPVRACDITRMTRHTALLRGVNVGRANRVPMAEFRALLESLGYREVQTLLNSGNAVFSAGTGSAQQHAERIRVGLVERLGVDVPVIVKSAREFASIVDGNVLAELAKDASRLLVAFTQVAKSLQGLAALAPLVRAPERLHVGEHAAYLWCPDGILASKAAEALLGKLGSAATTRNWATVQRLSVLLRGD